MDAKVNSHFNSYWSGDQNDRKSTDGYLFMHSLTPTSWSLNKHGVVVLYLCEAKYVAASYDACEALWLEMLLGKLNVRKCQQDKFLVYNQSTIDLANHPIRSMHI